MMQKRNRTVGENPLLKISIMLFTASCFHDENCPTTQLSLLMDNQDASITQSGGNIHREGRKAKN